LPDAGTTTYNAILRYLTHSGSAPSTSQCDPNVGLTDGPTIGGATHQMSPVWFMCSLMDRLRASRMTTW
jgi:hypothetical protein